MVTPFTKKGKGLDWRGGGSEFGLDPFPEESSAISRHNWKRPLWSSGEALAGREPRGVVAAGPRVRGEERGKTSLWTEGRRELAP